MITTNIKSVIIALDYDPTSQKVAEAGYALAQSMHAGVTLLHVMVDTTLYATAFSIRETWQFETMEVMDAMKTLQSGSLIFLKKAKQHLADDSILLIEKEGDPAQMILETALEIKADCIVMGSHSQKWLENIVMGSVTEEVLRKISIPLFIIPTKKK